MIQMKRFILALLGVISVGFCSCQTNTLQVVYSSDQNYEPTEYQENQVYRLIKQVEYADFNINKLNDLDANRKDSTSLREIFEPVSGDYNYYQFVATFKGLALIFPGDEVRDCIQTFHDILIVKTDNENKIIDAFQYTLEWGEYPCQFDLFRSSNSNIPLVDDMDINMLKFTRTEYGNAKDRLLMEKGTIKLNKDGR